MVAHDGVAVDKCTSIRDVYDEWVLKTQPPDVIAILHNEDEDNDLFAET